jgi:hypothetical protein
MEPPIRSGDFLRAKIHHDKLSATTKEMTKHLQGGSNCLLPNSERNWRKKYLRKLDLRRKTEEEPTLRRTVSLSEPIAIPSRELFNADSLLWWDDIPHVTVTTTSNPRTRKASKCAFAMASRRSLDDYEDDDDDDDDDDDGDDDDDEAVLEVSASLDNIDIKSLDGKPLTFIPPHEIVRKDSFKKHGMPPSSDFRKKVVVLM